MRNKTITIIGVYRPPAISGVLNSVTAFTDDFMDIVQDELINNNNLLILGDFNIHVDDEENVDAQSFMDCMNSMGLDQHVRDFTHNKLHTLDLIFSEYLDGLKISNVRTDLFVSDHSAVIAELEMERDDIRKVTKTTRSLKHLTCYQLSEELNYKYSDDSTLEELVTCFEEESRRCMDKLAPTKNQNSH